MGTLRRDYANRVAVITGAAGGLGKALASELALRGCHLALIDIRAAELDATANGLAHTGTRVTQHIADVACEGALRQVASDVLEQHLQVDLLINNAGISISAPFERTGEAAFERVIQVNFLGCVYGCRAFLPILVGRQGAQIVNVASSFAWLGYPGKTAYSASKGAVRAFSECLRIECAPRNVGVTLLYPGPLNTNIVIDGVADSKVKQKLEMDFLKARGIPLDRVARRVVTALQGNPHRIVIGSDYHLLDALARISPGLASWVVRKGSAVAGF